MRLKFVICDDIPGVARTIKDMIVNELSLRENDVKCFSFTDNLLDYFKNNSCDNIIIDLAMDSTGLPKKDRDASKSSTLTGWVFINNYIINGDLKNKFIDTKIFIFSGYGNILSKELAVSVDNEKFDINKLNDKLQEYRDNIYFFKKKGTYGGVDKLIEFLNNT